MSICSISVSPKYILLKKGENYLNQTVKVDGDTTTSCLEWCSADPSIAGVHPDSGRILANGVGKTKVYVNSIFDTTKKDYIEVEVTDGAINVQSIELSTTSVAIEKGDTFELTATVSPYNATNKSINWSSSNTNVATVSNGVVTAKAKGWTFIYARANDCSEVEAMCFVEVTEDVLVTSVTVSWSKDEVILNKNLTVGKVAYASKTVCPCDATDKTVTWSSDDESVAIVNPDSGLVTAKAVGEATIRATAKHGSGVYGECTVTVVPPIHVTGIETCEKKCMVVGDIEYLCTTVLPSNATNKTVRYCSSNPSVATVELFTGIITAKKAGTTTITATTDDGGFQACCTVTVDYCGGLNYRDVTKHNMVLQSDGYYVCSKCGYRVKSPELEDHQILSNDDYLKVFSCIMFYGYLEVWKQKFPSISDFELSQNTALQLATEIRQKSTYTNRYLYSDGNGKCVGPNIDYKYYLSFVESRDLNAFNIGDFNGLTNSIHELVIGIYCPPIAMTQNILDLITHQMNGIDFMAMVSDLFEYSDLANGLSIVSALMDATDAGISKDDKLIVVKLNGAIQGNFIFSPAGQFKMVKYT